MRASRIRAAARDGRGIASIEFAIIMSAIVGIVLATYDLGGYVLQQMKLAEAVYVGGQDVISYPPTDVNNSNDPNTQNLMTAIQNALPPTWILGADITVTLTPSCGCGGTALTADRGVTITLQRNYALLLIPGVSFPGLTSTTATYYARIQ